MKQFFLYLLNKKWIIFCILFTILHIGFIEGFFNYLRTYDPRILDWDSPQSRSSIIYLIWTFIYLILAYFTKFKFQIIYFILVFSPWLPIIFPHLFIAQNTWEANIYFSMVFPILFWLGVPQKALLSKIDFLVIAISIFSQILFMGWSPIVVPYFLVQLLPVFYIYKINQKSNWAQKINSVISNFARNIASRIK